MNNVPKFRVWHKAEEYMLFVTMLNISAKRCVCTGEPGTHFETVAENLSFDEIELMQWTGFKDEKGVDIYEGDVLIWRTPYNVETILITRYSSGCLDVTYPYFLEKPTDDLMEFNLEDWKVVGNMYENPELLNGEDE